jgi:hypothetical protein
MRLGEWPEVPPDWYCLFLVQAALMMALVRCLIDLFRGFPDWPPDRKPRSLLRWFWGRLLGGRPYYGKGPTTMLVAAILFLPDTDMMIVGKRPLDWWLLLMFAGSVGTSTPLLVLGLLSLVSGRVENAKTFLKGSVVGAGIAPRMAPFFCPGIGFLVAELIVGQALPSAFGAPLYGMMIGWAVGNVAWALGPFGEAKAPVPAPEAVQDQAQPGPPA